MRSAEQTIEWLANAGEVLQVVREEIVGLEEKLESHFASRATSFVARVRLALLDHRL